MDIKSRISSSESGIFDETLIPSEIVKIVCNGDIDIISKLNPNSKQVIYNMLMEITRKMNPKITFGKGKREVYDNIMAILRSKTVFSDIFGIRDIRKYLGDFNMPDVLKLTNDYKTCFNGFSFERKSTTGGQMTLNFDYECLANIFVWLPNLLKNYPKKVRVFNEDGKSEMKNVKAGLIVFNMTDELSVKEQMNIANRNGIFIYFDKETIMLRSRYYRALKNVKNDENGRIDICHKIFSLIYGSEKTLKISIGLGSEIKEEVKETKEVKEMIIEFPKKSGFKKSKRWETIGDVNIFTTFVDIQHFIGFRLLNKNADNLQLGIGISYKFILTDDRGIQINEKYKEEFMNFIKIFNRLLEIPNEPIPEDELTEFNNIEVLLGYLDIPGLYNSRHDGVRLEIQGGYIEENKLLFLRKDLIGHGKYFVVEINLNHIKDKYYPCFAKETKKVLTFEIRTQELGDEYQDLDISTISSSEERKKWEKLWDLLYLKVKKQINALDNFKRLAPDLLKYLGLTLESFLSLIETKVCFYSFVSEGGWKPSRFVLSETTPSETTPSETTQSEATQSEATQSEAISSLEDTLPYTTDDSTVPVFFDPNETF